MAKYKLVRGGIQNKETMAFIPDNLDNRDWRKYQAWLAEGNIPDPEFTQAELDVQKQKKLRSIETAIVNMRLRKGAADAEGLIELAGEAQAELDELRTELIQEQEEL